MAVAAASRDVQLGLVGQRPVRPPNRPLGGERREEPVGRIAEAVGEARHRSVDGAQRQAQLVAQLPVQREAEHPGAQHIAAILAALQQAEILLDEAADRGQGIRVGAQRAVVAPVMRQQVVDDHLEQLGAGVLGAGQGGDDDVPALGDQPGMLRHVRGMVLVDPEPVARLEVAQAHAHPPRAVEEHEG